MAIAANLEAFCGDPLEIDPDTPFPALQLISAELVSVAASLQPSESSLFRCIEGRGPLLGPRFSQGTYAEEHPRTPNKLQVIFLKIFFAGALAALFFQSGASGAASPLQFP